MGHTSNKVNNQDFSTKCLYFERELKLLIESNIRPMKQHC